jgi:hypothetical protein
MKKPGMACLMHGICFSLRPEIGPSFSFKLVGAILLDPGFQE